MSCIRIKEKNKLLKKLNLSTDKIYVDYLLYFEENFMYPIKNIPIEDEPNFRRVGNRYDLRLVRNIVIKV